MTLPPYRRNLRTWRGVCRFEGELPAKLKDKQ